MEYLKVKTKDNSNPQGKPRVYFTCHPNDFERSFIKVCGDIFKTHDCAIYYTEDMSHVESVQENLDLELGRMNLFVIPISFSLLSTKSRTMSIDYPYAVEHHIPVLPIMLETGLDEIYSRKDMFGERQYLNPYNHDSTEISYEEKLKKYLESVLIDDKTAERVRAAFDAYIFLSYRKKDRCYANELMRIIHNNPVCRDVAIWYDEFLTPGENFNDMIGKALEKSELFTLLVTPNLINEENYVRSVEYPEACKAGKRILPVEMQETDKDKLRKQYDGIPECANAYRDAEFRERLIELLNNIPVRESETDPEHDFLIGLAYLDGIDVEVNRERALELIISAAEAELPEAMEKLAEMYHEGIGVKIGFRDEFKWRKKLADYYIKTYGEKHIDTLVALNNLAYTYNYLGDYRNAVLLFGRVYELQCEVIGEEHPDTLATIESLADSYVWLDDYENALKFTNKCYDLRCKVLGEEHPDTIETLTDLSFICGMIDDYLNALVYAEKIYGLQCKIFGEEHPNTLVALIDIAEIYGELSDHKRSSRLLEQVRKLSYNVICEEHWDMNTVRLIGHLTHGYKMLSYSMLDDHIKHLKSSEYCAFLETALVSACKVLGEENAIITFLLEDLASFYGRLGDYSKAIEFYDKCANLQSKLLGKEHPDTLSTLYILAGYLGYDEEALEIFRTVYEARRRIFGEDYLGTINVLHQLLKAYDYSGKTDFALDICDRFMQSKWELTEEIIEYVAWIYEKNSLPEKAVIIRTRLFSD